MTPWNTTTPRDDGVTTVRSSWRAEIIHPDGTVTVEGAQLAATRGRGGAVSNEPVIAGFSVTAIVAAVIGALVAFGVWTPTAEQVAAVTTLAIIAASIAAAIVVRAKVTPTKNVPLPPPAPPQEG